MLEALFMLPSHFFFSSYLLVLRLNAPSSEKPDLSIPSKLPPSPRKAALLSTDAPYPFPL